MGVWFREKLKLPNAQLLNVGNAVTVDLALIGNNNNPQTFYNPAGEAIMSPNKFFLPVDGAWEAELEPISTLNPSGGAYRRLVEGPGYAYTQYFTVPTTQKVPLTVTSAVRTGGVVTLTVSTSPITAGYVIGDRVFTNLALATYDGVFTLTNVTSTTLVYASAGGDLGTSTGTVGKLWAVSEQFVDPPDSLPVLTPANRILGVKITTPSAALAVNAFLMTAIPGYVLTVPSLPYPTRIEAEMPMKHSVVSVPINLVFAPPSTAIGAHTYMSWDSVGAQAGAPVTIRGKYEIPANTPGTVQAYAYSTTTGTITVDAAAQQPGTMELLTV